MQGNIQGDLENYDWMDPNADFTDLGFLRQRWIDAQMLDLGLEFRLWDHPFGLPIEVWPAGGFQWQRFGIMCYDLLQVKQDNVRRRKPYSYKGDVISFKQDYYFCYVGGQLRTTLDFWAIPPIQLTFQGDWGLVNAYNVDHHLIREGDRYTMETTSGDSWHIAFTAEAQLSQRLSLGFEVDYLQIRTTGRHRWLNVPEGIDQTWDHGVRVWSDQVWLTAFICFRI